MINRFYGNGLNNRATVATNSTSGYFNNATLVTRIYGMYGGASSSIIDANIDENGHLILYMSDGS